MTAALGARLDQTRAELAAVKTSLADLKEAHRAATLNEAITALDKWTDRPHLAPGLHLAIGVLTSLRDDLDPPTPDHERHTT
ncbi:hypothetical protein DMH12_36200 [Streptomyces sp. WAC 04229]|uniref:hypothetical protein n=1 Tax=Streptomyces sp. WAC 04229 TaxID=2203206 RepID=UPI000F73BEF0|nr:hypothetical protein [Streptomyces sp. WAC 04229]RSN39999.1 hypothetical protein DMH12_36200 [Streptomyces sp. WAC 04229]